MIRVTINKPLRIKNTDFYATRFETKYSVHTRIEYKPQGRVLVVDAISVSTSVDLVLDGEVWPPAKINWTAFGSVDFSLAAGFAEAMKFALKEATAIDKKIIARIPRAA